MHGNVSYELEIDAEVGYEGEILFVFVGHFSGVS